MQSSFAPLSGHFYLSTFRLWVPGATIVRALLWHGRYHCLGRKEDLRGPWVHRTSQKGGTHPDDHVVICLC